MPASSVCLSGLHYIWDRYNMIHSKSSTPFQSSKSQFIPKLSTNVSGKVVKHQLKRHQPNSYLTSPSPPKLLCSLDFALSQTIFSFLTIPPPWPWPCCKFSRSFPSAACELSLLSVSISIDLLPSWEVDPLLWWQWQVPVFPCLSSLDLGGVSVWL